MSVAPPKQPANVIRSSWLNGSRMALTCKSNDVITWETDLPNAEALTRYSTAKEYVETIKLALTSPNYKDKHVIIAIRPTGLLAGFALELYLKSWLLADGMASRNVEKQGHKLKDLHQSAIDRGFCANTEISQLVDMISVPHGQDRDYIYRYTKQDAIVPILPWDIVLPIFHNIDAIVDRHVGASASFGLPAGR